VLATVVGMFMAFNVGGNDVANSFGTSVGAGTLTMKQALLVAAIFEVSGAVIAGGDVTETIRSGIVDLSRIPVDPKDFMNIMMSALLAAALWLLFANRMGYPVSITHSIVGGIVGAAITLGFVGGQGGGEAMLLFKGFKHMNLGLTTMNTTSSWGWSAPRCGWPPFSRKHSGVNHCRGRRF
jgi:PiT family inorganic phosphate transporter